MAQLLPSMVKFSYNNYNTITTNKSRKESLTSTKKGHFKQDKKPFFKKKEKKRKKRPWRLVANRTNILAFDFLPFNTMQRQVVLRTKCSNTRYTDEVIYNTEVVTICKPLALPSPLGHTIPVYLVACLCSESDVAFYIKSLCHVQNGVLPFSSCFLALFCKAWWAWEPSAVCGFLIIQPYLQWCSLS